MGENLKPVLRAAAIAAFTVGTLLVLLNPPSLSGAEGLATTIAIAVVIVLFVAWGTVSLMGDDGMSEAEFEQVVQRSERMAAKPGPVGVPDEVDSDEAEFQQLVADAIDRLPQQFREVLETVPVIVSYHGAEFRAYGHYYGDTVARGDREDRIVLYRDTLERDFGWDRDLLAAQVERTLLHELAHHLGWGEPGVQQLGL